MKIKMIDLEITDNCRRTHSDVAAFDVAVEKMRMNYTAAVRTWPIGKGAKIEISMTLDRPVPDLRSNDGYG